MLKPRARKTLLVLILSTTALVVGRATPGEKRSYLTVPEARRHAKLLNGQQVRVRGYAEFTIYKTQLLCKPARCDCNQAWGELFLFEKDPKDPQSFFDLASISISRAELKCEGNDCSMDCIPFDPCTAKEFEFVGTLRIDHEFYFNGLVLENLDLESSRQLIDKKWVPIETGRFTIEREDW